MKYFSGVLKRTAPLILACQALFVVLCSYSFAAEITIACTGDTHAMLYPCNCPREPDGGIARRVALVKSLRGRSRHFLLVDSGGFFGGGQSDSYSQNSEMDKRRTLFYLRGMQMAGYDAVAVGFDEFNFGLDFLEQNVKAYGLPAVSANIKADFLKRFIIKDVAGMKVGITSIVAPSVSMKAAGLKVEDPISALKKAAAEMKALKVDCLILLSGLNEQDSRLAAKEVPGIKVVVLSKSGGEESRQEYEGALFLQPSWQGRHLVKAELAFEKGVLTGKRTESIRLSSEISGDKQALSELPACFADFNCRKNDVTGACLNPGEKSASCSFRKQPKVPLTVLTLKDCLGCDTDAKIAYLKGQFGGLDVSYIYYPGAKAAALVKKLGLITLPVYLFGPEVEKEAAFTGIKDKLEFKGGYYVLSPAVGGIAFFLDRPHAAGRLDVFMGLFEPKSSAVIESLREIKPELHFLATDNGGKLEAQRGIAEIQEYLRAVCAKKYAPGSFWDYVSCRSRDINSSWWEDCLPVGTDAAKIKACAKCREGEDLLRENIGLNNELGVMAGPTFLVNNTEIFGVRGVFPKEDLKKLLGQGPRR